MSKECKQSTEAAVREIRRKTRRKFSPEEKVRIVLEGLRGEQSISELCRREASPQTSTTAGARASSRPAGSSWPATPFARRLAMKRRGCAPRTGTSRKLSPRSHLRTACSKKSDGSWRGGRNVRRTASEKMEIIRLVEATDLPVRTTLRQMLRAEASGKLEEGRPSLPGLRERSLLTRGFLLASSLLDRLGEDLVRT